MPPFSLRETIVPSFFVSYLIEGTEEKTMDDSNYIEPPAVLPEIEEATRQLEFDMGSDYQTGILLRTLAATKPGGRFLELGTGTGLATAWILDGMDRDSRLITVDIDPACLEVAKRHLGNG